jgi:hypothetical protein
LIRQSSAHKVHTVDPDAKHISLEHILPQNERKHVNWRPDFGQNIETADYVYRIGSLTLLTQGINNDLADDSFQEKSKIAFTESELLIDEYVKKATKWGDEEIEQRQQQLTRHAVQVWKL